MDGLCKHCPKLKYLYMSQVGTIERVSVKDLKSLGYKDKFQHLESIRIYYHGVGLTERTRHRVKYIKDYLISKCPKINGIVTDLSTGPVIDIYPDPEDDLNSISICSASYVNFYLKDSYLVEEKVTLRNQDDDDDEKLKTKFMEARSMI